MNTRSFDDLMQPIDSDSPDDFYRLRNEKYAELIEFLELPEDATAEHLARALADKFIPGMQHAGRGRIIRSNITWRLNMGKLARLALHIHNGGEQKAGYAKCALSKATYDSLRKANLAEWKAMLNDPDLCKFWIERAEFAEAQHRKDPPSN